MIIWESRFLVLSSWVTPTTRLSTTLCEPHDADWIERKLPLWRCQVQRPFQYSSSVPSSVCSCHYLFASHLIFSKLCLCSICRKVGGVGGSINLGGHSETLQVEGKENLRRVYPRKMCTFWILIPFSVYHAVLNRGTPQESRASSERNFCKLCGSMLWLYDKQWFATFPNSATLRSRLSPCPLGLSSSTLSPRQLILQNLNRLRLWWGLL